MNNMKTLEQTIEEYNQELRNLRDAIKELAEDNRKVVSIVEGIVKDIK